MSNDKVFAMPFAKVFPLLIAKAEKKGRTREEVYEVTCWLTGYTAEQLDALLESPAFGLTFDVGHNFVKQGQDEPVIMARKAHLHHMHLHDVKDGTKDHQALGTGDLDIFKCLNLAKEQDISVVVETKTIAGLKQSAAWLHENWK